MPRYDIHCCRKVATADSATCHNLAEYIHNHLVSLHYTHVNYAIIILVCTHRHLTGSPMHLRPWRPHAHALCVHLSPDSLPQKILFLLLLLLLLLLHSTPFPLPALLLELQRLDSPGLCDTHQHHTRPTSGAQPNGDRSQPASFQCLTRIKL